ncbi:uncharacterized protein EV422DRAFT_507196 [Fimicolochytrium jonesii]|uniref:uncharacterized protein n=1 Tax=Fimicolochytrium jonesii TaxID=1396493 RepID=UPI0022FE83F8|nr:uncharacterized protein EV422DRAFT_507196 [Fimicolochytrium jonesii]KAI8819540.1 hypothetical protein EV422DRAFT_507196 [Fimicolochytrium jonesii]
MTLTTPLPTVISRSAGEQRRRVLQLYRDALRAAPDILEMYRMPYGLWQFRNRIRAEFAKNLTVTDHQVIDVLIFKGRNELTETTEQWKQDDHVQRFFPKDTYAQPERQVRPGEDDLGRRADGRGVSEFLANFYEGHSAGLRGNDYA